MNRLFAPAVVVAALVAVMAPAPAGGATHDQLAYLTFNAPVQIPGVTLSAGTYRFHLTNPDTGRSVIQVLGYDGAIVYAMFHTIPDSRTVLTDDPMVTFRETPAGVPPPIRSLFYGGEYRGYEFVYPEGGPNMFVEEWQPPITYMALPAVPQPVVEPVAEPVPEPVVEPEPEPEPAQEPVPAELPRTASPLPFIATGGIASLLIGLGLRRRR